MCSGTYTGDVVNLLIALLFIARVDITARSTREIINIPRERSDRIAALVSVLYTTDRAHDAIYFRRDLLHPIELRAADLVRTPPRRGCTDRLDRKTCNIDSRALTLQPRTFNSVNRCLIYDEYNEHRRVALVFLVAPAPSSFPRR